MRFDNTPAKIADVLPIEFEEKKALIEKIENLNLQTSTIDEIKEHVNRLITGFSQVNRIFSPGLILYRGIKYSQRPFSISNLIYPPLDKAMANRANREGHQLFYSSSSKKAIFHELVAVPSETLVMSTWVTTKPLGTNHIGYSSETFENLAATRNFPDTINDVSTSNLPNSDANKLIKDYLASKFCCIIQPDKQYLNKLTIAIAELFFWVCDY